jgi:protein SCO1
MPAIFRSLKPLLKVMLIFIVTVGSGGTGAAETAAGSDSPWGASYFPNVPLVTQDGKQVRFYDDLVKGKVVAINFIFTGCSASCSMETARLREVQDLLGERMGKDVFFYSISIDPDNDTPEALKHYAEKFKVGPGWVFLTGNNADITLLRQKLGLYMPALQNGKTDHNLSLIIGNQSSGRWMKASPFENPHILATQLGSWLHNWKLASANRNDYANAPTRLRQMSRGEELFRTRCASCHTLGITGDAMTARRAIGPDLAGVTRLRERTWLTRWLKEPDRMLAEKDPLAVALYAKYNKVAMPNLRLNDGEIASLLTYLEEEGNRSVNGKKLTREGP